MNDSIQNSINNNAVYRWLQDLRFMSENECLCVLQAKSINKFKSNGTTRVTTTMSKNKLNTQQQSAQLDGPEMDLLEFFSRQYDLISDQIARLVNKLLKNSFQNLNLMVLKLIDLVDETLRVYFKLSKKHNSKERFSYLLLEYLTPNAITIPFYSVTDNQNVYKDIEERLISSLNQIKNSTNLSRSIDNITNLKEHLKRIDDNYKIFNEKSIRLYIEIQLCKIYTKEPLPALTLALNHILEICLKNEPVKKMFIESNGILILFNTLRDSFFKSILELLLRTLSVLCSHTDSLASLKQVDCIGILTDILCDEAATEWSRTEAAGCVAQIASPSLDFFPSLTGFFENIQDLTRALTVLCRDSSDIEIFLIGIAALANLTFVDNASCECFRQFSTAQVLIENFYLKNYNSIFVKDQITTILANMALLENCRGEIFEFNGLNLLADFLFESPADYESNETELNACERVLQKAAIAISRFSKEAKYSLVFQELEVIQRLSILCHNPDERNNNDSIFIACLSALKQMHLTCESSLFKEKQIKKLLKIKSVKDSFLMCSSTTEESYV